MNWTTPVHPPVIPAPEHATTTDKKMRICFIINALTPGGAERFTANMANYWVSQGHAVCIATLADAGVDTYKLDAGVERVVLARYRPSQSTRAALYLNLCRLWRLSRFLHTWRPDVAIGIMAVSSCLLAIARAPRGTVRIGSERIHPPRLTLGRLWTALRRYSYAFLDTVVAQTDDAAIWLRAHTFARNVTVIPNPVVYPLESTAPRLEPEDFLGDNSRLLLSVGRLDPQKGFNRLIEAFGVVATDLPEWHLAIVGEGGERARLEQQISELGLSHRVVLPGRAGNVADWLDRADLFTMVSHFEGFPNVLIEAMSYGLPAVSFDCDTGPRDVIRQNVDGILVPQDDIAALVRALVDMMSDPVKRTHFAVKAIAVRDRFSMPVIAAQWEALFTETTARQSAE